MTNGNHQNGRGSFYWVEDPVKRGLLLELKKKCYGISGDTPSENKEPVSFEDYDDMSVEDLRKIGRIAVNATTDKGYCFHEDTLKQLYRGRPNFGPMQNPSTGLPLSNRNTNAIRRIADSAVTHRAPAYHAQLDVLADPMDDLLNRIRNARSAATRLNHARIAGGSIKRIVEAFEGIALGSLSQNALFRAFDPVHEPLFTFPTQDCRASVQKRTVRGTRGSHAFNKITISAWEGTHDRRRSTMRRATFLDIPDNPDSDDVFQKIKQIVGKIRTRSQLRGVLSYLHSIASRWDLVRNWEAVRPSFVDAFNKMYHVIVAPVPRLRMI